MSPMSAPPAKPAGGFYIVDIVDTVDTADTVDSVHTVDIGHTLDIVQDSVHNVHDIMIC